MALRTPKDQKSATKFDLKSVTKRKPLGNLPSGVGVGKVKFHGKERWRVRLGKRFTGGKVQTQSFGDLSGARDWIFGGEHEGSKPTVCEKIEHGVLSLKSKHGEGAFSLTGAQRAEAEDAFCRLPPGASLTEIVDDWLKRRAPAGGVKTMLEAGKEFLASRRNMGVRDRTLTMYESHLRIVNEEFGDLPIADLERSQIEDWLSESDWAPRTRKNYLVTLTTLLNFSQDREYCTGNPAARIERPLLDDRPPGILTVRQSEKLLSVTLHGLPEEKGVREAFAARPQMVAGIAIGMFAGLRRSEICRLNWSEVDLEGRLIEVKAAKAKTRQRRLVTISDNLAAWLEPSAKDSGPVAASTNEDVFGEHLKEIAAATGITEWPHNALRHSFGSYFYAHTKEENRTAAEMGNTPNVIFKHYRALVKETQAAQFWAIHP